MRKIDRDDPRKRAIRAERKGESKSVSRMEKYALLLEQRIFSVSKKLFFISQRRLLFACPNVPKNSWNPVRRVDKIWNTGLHAIKE